MESNPGHCRKDSASMVCALTGELLGHPICCFSNPTYKDIFDSLKMKMQVEKVWNHATARKKGLMRELKLKLTVMSCKIKRVKRGQ